MFAYRSRLGPVDVAFTDRAGGASEGVCGSLNLALSGPDDPAAVAENLSRVMRDFTGEAEAAHASMRQVHGAEVAEVTAGSFGVRPGVDGLVTSLPDVVLMVRAADCVPILLADPDAEVVAALHAGRRGVTEGIVGNGLAAATARGARRLVAWVGPHVCGRCYEVPEHLRAEVAATVPEAYAQTSWGTPALDLGAAVTAQLSAGGAEVVDASRCTLEHDDLHSYRRAGKAAGRMAGLIRRQR